MTVIPEPPEGVKTPKGWHVVPTWWPILVGVVTLVMAVGAAWTTNTLKVGWDEEEIRSLKKDFADLKSERDPQRQLNDDWKRGVDAKLSSHDTSISWLTNEVWGKRGH